MITAQLPLITMLAMVVRLRPQTSAKRPASRLPGPPAAIARNATKAALLSGPEVAKIEVAGALV